MEYWIYWTIFSVLAFGISGFIIKLLWDIRSELKFMNANAREGKCDHGYSDWEACPVCGH